MYSSDAYEAAHTRAAFLDRTSTDGRIIVTGRDRAAYLQGLLTNDIAALAAGRGCYAAYLTPQGRMIADLHVYELGDLILLTTPRSAKDAVLAKLDQFIFSEDVQLGDVTDTFAQIAVVGPSAADIVTTILDAGDLDALVDLPEHGNLRGTIQEQPAIVVQITDAGLPGFDLFVERALADGLKASLAARGVPDIGGETAETIRIEAGVPRFGRDMDAETIPLEAGIESRAISLTKGCYVGQEVIIRVLHRGHGRVARRLVSLALDSGDPPPAGAPVKSGERDVGRITSSARSPALGRPIALAYVHRDFTEPGTHVDVGGVAAEVITLKSVA